MQKPFHPCRYLEDPTSSFSEQIRSLRTNILRLLHPDKKSFLVTSSWEGEGKSTVCINLAAAFCEIGRRTLLVDGDLRQRSLSRLLLSPNPSGQPETTPWVPGALVLGSPALSPSEAAGRVSSPNYIGELKMHFEAFDVVIIDSPPMSVCSDALLLGAHLDGALMVVSEKKFQGVPEGHFSEDLREHGVPFWGSVVTDSPQ